MDFCANRSLNGHIYLLVDSKFVQGLKHHKHIPRVHSTRSSLIVSVPSTVVPNPRKMPVPVPIPKVFNLYSFSRDVLSLSLSTFSLTTNSKAHHIINH